jgi:hypothetical protein
MGVGDRDSCGEMGYRMAALVRLLLFSLTFTTWPASTLLSTCDSNGLVGSQNSRKGATSLPGKAVFSEGKGFSGRNCGLCFLL